MTARRSVLFVAPVIAALVAAAPQASAQAPAAASAAPEAALSVAELDRMLAPLGHDGLQDRRAASAAVAALGPEATPAVTQKLAELRKGGDGGVFTVIKGLRDRGNADLLAALVDARPDAATQRALTIVSLLRALAHAGALAATRQLVLLASDASGALRPEIGRQMRQLADRAVAALIEARRDPSTETRTWAATLLDAMNKHSPGDAVQTKDNQALGDVLRAYASVKDLEALPVVLSFVGSDRAQVRTAAREATVAYGQDAVWKLREAYAALTGDQPPDGMAAAELAKKLFDAYDRFRLQEVYALLDAGLAREKEDKLADAIADFNEVLARQPLLDRRVEMVPGYYAWALQLEPTDRVEALATLRRALRLDQAGSHAPEIRSEIDVLDGEELLGRGIADTEPFEHALALNPANERARATLDKLRARAQTNRDHGWRMGAAGLVLVLALASAALVGARRRAAATG